jgi:fatty-acid desaturase
MGHYIGNAGVIAGIYLLATGAQSCWWIGAWLLFHLLGSLMLSVGLHRYFAHGTFKTSVFWHRFMAYYSVLLLNGSPQGWAAAHNTHHIHSDTPNDPHYASWRYLINKRYRSVPMVLWRVKALSKDKDAVFVHRYGLLLWLVFALVLLAMSWQVFLFAYLMPLGSVHLIGAIHQITSHYQGAPRNLPWLEFIFPACGEWLHKTHHDHPGRTSFKTQWWHVDLGALFIKAIQKN